MPGGTYIPIGFGRPVQPLVVPDAATCKQIQDAINAANQLIALLIIDPFGARAQAEADKAVLLQKAKDLGCVVEDRPANFFTPLFDALAAGITVGVELVGDTVVVLLDAMKPAVAAAGKVIADFLTKAGYAGVASNIHIGGDLFALLGSLQDALVDRELLTRGALTFEELLAYEDRLNGLEAAIILGSFFFSIAVEGSTFGQVKGAVGLVVHMIDTQVSDYARVVKTQLVRRAIGDPLAEGYKAIHRTGRPSSGELEALAQHGLVSEDELVAGLALDGFNDRAVQVKTQIARLKRLENLGEEPTSTRKLSVTQLMDFLRSNLIDEETFVRGVARLGYDAEAIPLILAFARTKAAISPPAGGP